MYVNKVIFLLFNISLVFNPTADLDHRLSESSHDSVLSHGSRKIKVVVLSFLCSLENVVIYENIILLTR